MRLCDRCGKEIPRHEKVDLDVLHMAYIIAPLLGISGVDLCGKCKKALLKASKPWISVLRQKVQEWMKEEKRR